MEKPGLKGSYFSYFLMYNFHYMALALYSGLVSVYLMDRGFTATQVSTVIGVQYLLAILGQPVVGRLNDRFERKRVNTLLLVLAIGTGVAFIFARSLWPAAAAYAVTTALTGGVNTVVESMATTAPYRYGSIRIWGTIGYAVGLQAGGWLYRFVTPDAMYYGYVVCMLLSLVGLWLTADEAAPAAAREKGGRGGIFTGRFLLYLLIVALFYGPAMVSTTYLPAMYYAAGMTVDAVSFVVFLGTMMELPLIFFSGRFMNRVHSKKLLLLAYTMIMVQFAVYAFVPLIPVRAVTTVLIRSVTTMIFLMLNLKIVATLVPPESRMTALALVASFKSLVAIGFQRLGGAIIDNMSYERFYLTLLCVTAAGFVLSLLSPIDSGDGLDMFK
ncbi:MAG: MFS transporter [Ruminococcaceae bacterium]|nr:MFS transporter [Oscillospiraceae bacterium]